MGTKFCGVKILRICWNIFIIKFLKVLFSRICYGCNYDALFGLIVRCLVLVDQWTSDGKRKQHAEFLFSGQWLNESNEGKPFSSLSYPSNGTCSCVGENLHITSTVISPCTALKKYNMQFDVQSQLLLSYLFNIYFLPRYRYHLLLIEVLSKSLRNRRRLEERGEN